MNNNNDTTTTIAAAVTEEQQQQQQQQEQREARKEKRKEFIALVLWLQNCFPVVIGKDAIIREDDKQINVEELLEALNTPNVARAIREIAGEVCHQPLTEEEEHNIELAAQELSNHPSAVAEQIWTSVLMLTSTLARPLGQEDHVVVVDNGGANGAGAPVVSRSSVDNSHDSTMDNMNRKFPEINNENDEAGCPTGSNAEGASNNNNNATTSSSSSKKMSPIDLKAYTMANILDCAVNNPDKVKRRQYIEGILEKLNKSTQKRLMAMVNRRVSPPSQTQQSQAQQSSQQAQQPSQQASQAAEKSTTSNSNSNSNNNVASKISAINNRNSSNSARKSNYRSASTPPAADRGPSPSSFTEPIPSTPRSRSRSVSAERSTQRASSRSPVTHGRASPVISSLTTMTSNFRTTLSLGNCASALQQQIAPMDSDIDFGGSFSSDSSSDGTSRTSSHRTESPGFNESNNRNNKKNAISKYNNNNNGTPQQHRHHHPRSSSNNNPLPTPPPYRQYHRNHNNRLSDVSNEPPPPGFLSPGTLDSPGAIQNIVGKLQHRNEELDGQVSEYQKREVNWRQELERVQQDYRKEMIQIEAAALQREQDTQQQYEERLRQMQHDMQSMQDDVQHGQAAAAELQQARDDMELFEHNKRVLSETTEKLRRYKDKVTELQDAKQALTREQDAHGQAVDEICRLEHEIQLLQPYKKQLEEYKIRAIEAEVKLVENQDYVRRMEEQLEESSANNDNLWKESVNQKAQMEELVQRIHEETQANIEQGLGGAGISGIGEGFSELNPEIKSELIRLRNENLQLRAFAAKRQDDEVTRLESKLGDSQSLAERYKDEYLDTKNSLHSTQSVLADTQQREAKLTLRVEELTQNVDDSQREVCLLEEKLTLTSTTLQNTEQALSQSKEENEQLSNTVQELQQRIGEVEGVAQEHLTFLNQTTDQLEATRKNLESSESTVQQLQETVKAWESSGKQMETEIHKMQEDLNETKQQLDQKRQELDVSTKLVTKLREETVKKLEEEKQKLDEQLEEERLSNSEALEATRQVLTAKLEQDLEEQANNMNVLLEDERKAGQERRQESDEQIAGLQSEIEELQERFASSMKHSRQEAQERVDFLRSEHKSEMETLQKQHQDEIQKVRKEDEDKLDHIVRKGKKMIEDAKDGAYKQLRAMEDQCSAMEEKLETEQKSKREMEHGMRGTIIALKQKLESSVERNSSLSEEVDGLEEKIKLVQREKFKLQDDNDRYRRQISGRNGADGGRAHLEQLQKEYKEVLDENRQLKQQVRNLSNGSAGAGLGTISESPYMADSSSSSAYSNRNSVSRSTLQQYHLDYEQTIERVTGEKRELVMKHASAIADVQRAEQRVVEREQVIARVQAENTSLKLALQRADLSMDQSFSGRSTLPTSPLSYFSAREEEEEQRHTSPGGIFKPVQPHRHTNLHHHNGSPSVDRGSPTRHTIDRSSPARSSSPSIDRAKQHKESQEQALRTRLSSMNAMSWSPPRHNRVGSSSSNNHESTSLEEQRATASYASSSPGQIKGILSPTQKHEQSANQPLHKTNRDFGVFSAPKARTSTSADSPARKTNSDFGVFGPAATNDTVTPPSGRKVRLSNEPPVVFDYFTNSQSIDTQEEQDITLGWERQFTA